MKVLQVIPNLCMGGAETMCETLTLELIKKGVEVKIVSLYNYDTTITQRLVKNGVEIVFLDKKPGLDLSIVKKLRKIFDEEKPDVVHSHLNAQKYAVIAARRAKVTVCIHTVHSVAKKELNTIDKLLAKYFYTYYNVIPVALNLTVRDTIEKEYKLHTEYIPIIFNGMDLSKCITKKIYIQDNVFTVLHIGRFQSVKNHSMLLRGFWKFHKKYPKSILKLIGEGELRKDIETLICDLKLDDSVELLGLQSNVFPYLNEADVFVLPSTYEGLPMTLIEAMGTGLPIVATNVGGIPDMLDENSSILVPVDVNKLAAAFERYYNDAELREKHGKSALKRSQEFSAEAMASNYIKLYLGEYK